MPGFCETDSGRGLGGGRFRDLLAQLSRLATALAALALLSLVGLAWASYPRGRPVDLFGVRLAVAPSQGSSLPAGAVIVTVGETCPRPWREYLPAQGRFVLGAGSGAALNFDANGLLVPVHRPGDVGSWAGVELLIADIPAHTHRMALGAAPAGHEETVAFAVETGTPETLGVLMPFAMKTSPKVPLQTRRFKVVDLLETVGVVMTRDRGPAARRHDNIPPFVALTYCVYSPDIVLDVARSAE
jgi:hypothetical protein